MSRLTQPIKRHGGKHYLATKIVGLMPAKHTHYVEPFFGGGSVLLAKPFVGISEVVNDLESDLTNFWRVLKSEILFPEFLRYATATPFSETEYEDAVETCESEGYVLMSMVERAIAFFIRCRQSLAGRMQNFATLSKRRTRRNMNEQVSAWLTTIEGLPAVHDRLKRVAILNRPAVDCIRSEDTEETLFYCDPPYLHETRATTGEYKHEMSEADHAELLQVLLQCKGKVMLSGYRSELYDGMLSRWRRVDWEIDNKASGGKTKRTMVECVWMNF